jgi:osmotically-inducible protein OsmY
VRPTILFGTQGTRPAARPPTDAEVAAWCTLALEELEEDRRIPRDRVEVSVKNGWVELRGDVDEPSQRAAAERAVLDVPGVKGVDDRIAIVPRVGAADLVRAIELALTDSSGETDAADRRSIAVDVDEGNVVLAGTVRSLAEREIAERVAWTVPGIVSVENRIDVVP